MTAHEQAEQFIGSMLSPDDPRREQWIQSTTTELLIAESRGGLQAINDLAQRLHTKFQWPDIPTPPIVTKHCVQFTEPEMKG